jgi:four helix bundle protein
MKTDDFNFKELMIWDKAIRFAKNVITIVEQNKSDRHHFRLLEQIESSVSSISMNIAEGKGRYSKKEFVQYLYIARGSLYETITLLNIFFQLNWIDKNDLIDLEEQGKELGRMINGFINSIKDSKTNS